MLPTGDLADNPGMCPDWELNQWPFGSQIGTPSTEPHQPGHHFNFLIQGFIYLHLETKLIIVFQGIILHIDIIIAFKSYTFNS